MKKYRTIPIAILFLIILTIFAFWKSYFGILNNLPETATKIIHIHASIMLIWLLMLLVQAWLIRNKKFKTHRFIGRTSYVFAPILIWSGLILIHEVFNRTPDDIPVEFARLNVYSFGQLFIFLVMWSLAIYYRKNVNLHMRFMISTAFAIGIAIIFRIFFFWIPNFDSFSPALIGSWAVMSIMLIILITLDWKKGIKISPYWIVTVLISLVHISYWTITKNSLYLNFCEWFSNLPTYIFFG